MESHGVDVITSERVT